MKYCLIIKQHLGFFFQINVSFNIPDKRNEITMTSSNYLMSRKINKCVIITKFQ
jgi:hypothetical protein